jgi:hypothetical protein
LNSGNRKGLSWLPIFVIVVLLNLPLPSRAQPNTSQLNTEISGKTTFWNGSIDLCSLIHVSSCPISLSINENFAQNVITSFETNSAILQPGDSLVLTATTNPSAPTVNISLIFSVVGHNFTYNYTLQNLPRIGKTDLISIPIPVGLVLQASGITIPIPVSLNLDVSVSSQIVCTLQENSFTGSNALVWDSAESKQAQFYFLGNTETTLIIVRSFESNQVWSASLKAGIPSLGSISLVNIPYYNTTFIGSGGTIFSWYHVVISQPQGGTIMPVSGSHWYASGYKLQLAWVAADSYQFKDWMVNGQVVSTGTTLVYTVQSPTIIEAEVVKQSMNAVIPPDIVPELLTGLIVTTLVCTWAILRSRKRKP